MERPTVAQAFEKIDEALCMICGAHGNDKRTLVVRCFYDVQEVVPEMIDCEEGYMARICKSCRGDFLGKMKEWADARRALRPFEKDHDGYVEQSADRNIPVRVNGAIVMMNDEEYANYQREHSGN